MNKLNFENIHNNLPKNRVNVDIFEEIDSTNDEAKRISLENEFHLIITEKQSKGRGRHGKTWSSPDSQNIYMTICTQNDLSFVPESLVTGVICRNSINQINKCVAILKTKPKIKRTMWSRRAQEYDQKINSGKIYELAEVVKDLNKNTDIIADQSYSERQLFEKAYERLKSEFEAVLKVSPEEVQKKMDKALGRSKISEEA